MNLVLPTLMTVDDFLRWSERQERGRYELEAGRVIAMPSETFGHVALKDMICDALKAAIKQSGLPLYALPDGMAVRVADDVCFEPDAMVAELPRPDPKALEVTNPLVVVEVLSPSTMRRDLTTKVVGYAQVASIEHYIVVDPAERVVLHFRRQGSILAQPEQPATGVLKLDPPGLELAIADMLGPEPPAA